MTLLGRVWAWGSRGLRGGLWLSVVTLTACSNPAVAHTEGAQPTEQPPPSSSLASPAVQKSAPEMPVAPPSGRGERVVVPVSGPVAGGEPTTRPVPDEHIALQAGRDALQINLPPEANAGPRRLTYWLTGDEDVTIKVEVGSGSRPEAAHLNGALLIDGKQQKHSVDGRPAELWLSRSLEPHSVDAFSLKVPGRSIPPGIHSLALLFWYDNGKEFPGIGLTLRKGTAGSQSLSFASATRVLPGTGQRRLDVRTPDGSLPLLGGANESAHPRPNGDLSLVVHAEGLGDRGFGSHVAFAAFVDGRQVKLEPFGPAPHLRVDENAASELDVTLHGLPISSGHTLVVYALEGLGEPAELLLGEQNPALHPPRQIARLHW